MDESKTTGLIFTIQRDSTEDGPGIRTTVFLKGCPMRCPWCHNPESIAPNPELIWHEKRCIGDRRCVDRCKTGALALTERGMEIDRGLCGVCGTCERICPANALEILGIECTVQDVLGKVLRDKVFYEKTGGGVTISGGEPALQPGFSAALMKALRRESVHVALDTCAGTKWSALGPLVALADLVLLDLKLLDSDKHQAYLGVPLELVRENVSAIAKSGKPVWVRTPIIPGYTDSDANIGAIARFIKASLPNAVRYDLIAFNNTCEAKYQRLGRTWSLAEEALASEEHMEKLVRCAEAAGLDFVRWSGLSG